MRLRKGDPIPSDNTRTSTIDSRMLQALMDAEDSIDLNALEREQLKRESMYYEDPAGLEMKNPAFDILGLAGPKVVAAFGRRALGEAGEAAAKQAAKGVKPYMNLKSELDANVRELNSLIPKYEEAYDLVKSGSSSGGFTRQSLARAEKAMDDYGAKITDLKQRISTMVNGPSGKVTKELQAEVEEALMDYPDILELSILQNKNLQDAIASGNKAKIMIARDELQRLSASKKELEDLFDEVGIPAEKYMNRRDFGTSFKYFNQVYK
jgi:hypothetical protein